MSVGGFGFCFDSWRFSGQKIGTRIKDVPTISFTCSILYVVVEHTADTSMQHTSWVATTITERFCWQEPCTVCCLEPHCKNCTLHVQFPRWLKGHLNHSSSTDCRYLTVCGSTDMSFQLQIAVEMPKLTSSSPKNLKWMSLIRLKLQPLAKLELKPKSCKLNFLQLPQHGSQEFKWQNNRSNIAEAES